MSESGRSDGEARLIAQLHQLLEAIEVTGHAILPRSNVALLQSIVETAARILRAEAAAIALVTEDGQELEFKVAFNQINQDIVGMRFPVNEGIAGYVVMTGQPLTVSRADEDSRFNRSFAEEVGYIPKSILAVPLLQDEDVLGVIEVLDKDSGQPFGMEDIELLTIFANQAGMAISQSQQIANLQQMLIIGLKRLVSAGPDAGPGTAELLTALETQPVTDNNLIDLARLISDISAMGDAEKKVCRQILLAFQAFSQTKTSTQFGTNFGL